MATADILLNLKAYWATLTQAQNILTLQADYGNLNNYVNGTFTVPASGSYTYTPPPSSNNQVLILYVPGASLSASLTKSGGTSISMIINNLLVYSDSLTSAVLTNSTTTPISVIFIQGYI